MNNSITGNVKDDRFAKYVGIELVEVREGYAVAELIVRDDHLNGVNSVQGGAIFTLADYAFAAASNSYGFVTVGINVNISYFKAPSGKKIRAVAKEVSTQNRICGYDVDLLDEDGTIFARFNGLGYIKRK